MDFQVGIEFFELKKDVLPDLPVDPIKRSNSADRSRYDQQQGSPAKKQPEKSK